MKKMPPPQKINLSYLSSGHFLVDRLNRLLAGAEVKPASNVRIGGERDT